MISVSAGQRNPAESLWVLVSSAIGAMSSVLVKLACEGATPWEALFWRGITATLIVYTVMRIKGISVFSQHRAVQAVRMAAGSTSSMFEVLALSMLTVGTAKSITNTSALVIAAVLCVSALVHRQKPDLKLTAAVLVAFAGVLMISRPTLASTPMLGIAMAALSSLTGAAALTAIAMLGGYGEPILRTSFVFLAGTAILGAGGMLATGDYMPSASSLAVLAASAVALILSQMAMTRAWGRGTALLTGTLGYSSILFAGLGGVIVFGDRPDALTWLGMALIAVAGAAASALRLRRKSGRR